MAAKFFYVYFFGGLECVGHSFAYVAHLWFLKSYENTFPYELEDPFMNLKFYRDFQL
jgi:hypothetical protein